VWILGASVAAASSKRGDCRLSDSKVERLDMLGTPSYALVAELQIWTFLQKELLRVRVGDVLSHKNVDVD
jgi:hypothetical protein